MVNMSLVMEAALQEIFTGLAIASDSTSKQETHLTMDKNNQEQQKLLSSKSIALTGLAALALAPFTGGASLGVWGCHVGVWSAIDAHNESKNVDA